MRHGENIIVIWLKKNRIRRRPPTPTIKNPKSVKPINTIKSKRTSATLLLTTIKLPNKLEEEVMVSYTKYLIQYLGHKHLR